MRGKFERIDFRGRCDWVQLFGHEPWDKFNDFNQFNAGVFAQPFARLGKLVACATFEAIGVGDFNQFHHFNACIYAQIYLWAPMQQRNHSKGKRHRVQPGRQVFTKV